MQLADKPVLQSYHQLDYDWTPLSQNPCCVTADNVCAFGHALTWSLSCYSSWALVARPVPCVASTAITTLVLPGKQILCRWLCFGTRHCKHESSPCATICWGLTCASKIFHAHHKHHKHHTTHITFTFTFTCILLYYTILYIRTLVASWYLACLH